MITLFTERSVSRQFIRRGRRGCRRATLELLDPVTEVLAELVDHRNTPLNVLGDSPRPSILELDNCLESV
jgi:hypothetical protein